MNNAQLPPTCMVDARLVRLTTDVWSRLPNTVKPLIVRKVRVIAEVDSWDAFTTGELRKLGINRNLARWRETLGVIEISRSDCDGVEDLAVLGAIVHEFGHACQVMSRKGDVASAEKAADATSVEWGFAKEIAALEKQRCIDNQG